MDFLRVSLEAPRLIHDRVAVRRDTKWAPFGGPAPEPPLA
jgi:hypothetical protein